MAVLPRRHVTSSRHRQFGRIGAVKPDGLASQALRPALGSSGEASKGHRLGARHRGPGRPALDPGRHSLKTAV
jgi:hypothetical protein